MTKKYILNKPNNSQTEDYKKFARNLVDYSYRTASKKFPKNVKINSPLIRYSLDDINRWLENPKQNEERLRILSNHLYDSNPTYKVIVRYLALLPKYYWSLNIDTTSGNSEQIKKVYFKILKQIKKMNLDYELMKASISAYKNDFFYGYEIETEESYFLLHLEHKYCKITSIENGLVQFSFDFSYFDAFKDELDTYPQEFRYKYAYYKQFGDRWLELDTDKAVCFKTNIDILYGLPMFAGMFPYLYEADEYRKMKKDRAKLDNYLLLQQLIPIDDKASDYDKFLISSEVAGQFHNSIASSLQDGIEVVTSPMELTAIKTEKTKNDNDYVTEALREVYNAGGISQFLFNSDKNTSIGLSKSIQTDEQIAFMFLRQLETWINRKLRKQFPTVDLNFKFLDITEFNRDDKAKQILQAAQYGVPLKLEIAATMGMTPLDVYNKVIIENEILKLQDLFIPLASSHTQTGDEKEGGRPTKSDGEVSDSTVVGRDKDSDDRKVNG